MPASDSKARTPISGGVSGSPSSPPPAPSIPRVVDHDRVKAQMRQWQDRVLDLTKSNPLIGLNRSRVARLQIIEPKANNLFATLVIDGTHVRMPLVRRRARQPEQASLLDSDPNLVVDPGEVTFDAKPIEMMRCLRRIHDNAHTSVEERGVTTLYLTFGALRWNDELLGDSVSPVWMTPCEFENKGPDAPLRLCPADEDPQINPALEYYLRERHKIELPEIPDELDGLSLIQLLNTVRRTVKDQDWDVTDEVWLSTFSFESLVIYRDLGALTGAAATNPVTIALSRAGAVSGNSEALPHELDCLPTPGTVPIPVLPTDSSQLEALTHSALGRHVVVHGPPGTGKSQTIANLIVDALARNKKVLFVSAKMAALNVVYERLKELGLQRFCLEAHSTKAGKQKIIDELRRTLEAEPSRDGEALDRELQGLLQVRDELNAYARELHAPLQPFGASVYQANGRLAQLAHVAEIRGPLPWVNALDASRDEVDECLRALEELAANAGVFDEGVAHPWHGFSPTTFGLAEQETLESTLSALVELGPEIVCRIEKLECLIVGARSLSASEWELLRGLLAAVEQTEQLPPEWWQQTEEQLTGLAQFFREAAGRRHEMDTLLGELKASIAGNPRDLTVALSPGEARYGAWYGVFKPGYRGWRKQVEAKLLNGKFSRGYAKSLRERSRRALDIDEWFGEQEIQLSRYFAPGMFRTSAAFETLTRSFTVAALCKRCLAAVDREAAPAITLSVDVRNAASGILKILPNAQAALTRLDADWPEGFINGNIASRAPLPEVGCRARSLITNMQSARERVLLNRALQRCASQHLSAFLSNFGCVSASEAPRVFERRFLRLWLSSAIERSRTLAAFTDTKGADLIEKYRALDDRVRRLAVASAQMTASAASARVRAAEEMPENASEVGILRRELQKRKRIKPLRKLFAEIPQVLQALKPCLLMSPISVSTYLKPDVFHFDVVVFDEASQLPTAEAIPAVLRATQVVVAGDSRQLPPTSFFEASLSDENEGEDDEQAPLDSFLDDCVAVVPVFQESHLRWHYRSRDERLIKFSNHFFYDNRLITFPAANLSAAGQGVRFVHVADGVYDRGRSRTNRPEARMIAKLALEQVEQYPNRSLGIVALSLSQKEAIEDAIAEALLSRPDLAPFFSAGAKENVFIKSLENVQGDERDAMIIGVGYGRDQSGAPPSMNFGPINTDGGWRRLNVLVTRAKWECILVASLRARDLSNVNPQKRGAVALRDFLEFAERNGELPTDAPVQTDDETNDFEEAVRAALIDRGLKVDMQIGASHYRIDLAVRDPRDDRRYLLGVECDGATYHSSRNARDRDLLRQLVLQNMGWRIHRVWSTEWFHDRDRSIAAILRSVEQALQTPAAHPVYAPPADPPDSCADPPPATETEPPAEAQRRFKHGIPYSVFQPRHRVTRDHLLESSYISVLTNTITDLVAVEGPIHRDLIVDRLKEIHGVARAGANVQANIDRALRAAERTGTIACESQSPFYLALGRHLDAFRLPTDSVRRMIEYIAPSEISLAILYLIEDQFGVIEESLPQAVARILGIERLKSENADVIRAVEEDLVNKGLLRRAGTQVHLA